MLDAEYEQKGRGNGGGETRSDQCGCQEGERQQEEVDEKNMIIIATITLYIL